jgi:hypothetical protein
VSQSLLIYLFARFRSVERFVFHSNPIKTVGALNFERRDGGLSSNVEVGTFLSLNRYLDFDLVSIVPFVVFPFSGFVAVNVHQTSVLKVPLGCNWLGLTSLLRRVNYISRVILAAENLFDGAGWPF